MLSNTENIYEHIDASNSVLQKRLTHLDQRTAQQVFAIDRLTKERLAQEEKKCHGRIKHQFDQQREMILHQYREQARADINEWLDSKLSTYGHCLDHHHDDSALPNKNVFTDVHQMESGRLFKSRSDETLSQSDCSGKFRKKSFYESRQAAMHQIRGWQLPQNGSSNNIADNGRTTPAHLKGLGQGQIYSSQGHVKIGQIEVHPGPTRDSMRNPVQRTNVHFEPHSSNPAFTHRTPQVHNPSEDVYQGQRSYDQRGAIPKRIPQSQSWQNAKHLQDSIYHAPNPVQHSTPKVHTMNSDYGTVASVRNQQMTRSQTDPDGGILRASHNQYRQTVPERGSQRALGFPERGSSNINTGSSQASNSSGAGKDPQPPTPSSGGGTVQDDTNSRPTFTTFGYYEQDQNDSKDRVTDNALNVHSSSQRPGSTLQKDSANVNLPNGNSEDIYTTHRHSSQLSKLSQNADSHQEGMVTNGYGYILPKGGKDVRLSHKPPLPTSSRSSNGLLLDEEELSSAHEMKVKLKVKPVPATRSQTPNVQREDLRSQTPNVQREDLRSQTPNVLRASLRSQTPDFELAPRSQTPRDGRFNVSTDQGYQGENYYKRTNPNALYGQNPRNNPMTSSQGQYMAMTSPQKKSLYSDNEVQYTSMNELKENDKNRPNLRKDLYNSGFQNTQLPYHSTYNMNGQNIDRFNSEDIKNNPNVKSISKSDSNLLDNSGSSNCENSPRGNYLCKSPRGPERNATPDRDLRNVANFPNAYTKEDSSSNPDSGYSSKIFGNRLRPGQVPSNSCSPSFNSGTPSSSFSTDHNISTPGNSHTSSPYTPANHPDYEVMPSREHQQVLNTHVQDWYQKKLHEAAHKFQDGTYAELPPQVIHNINNRNRPTSKDPYTPSNGQYTAPYANNNQVYGSYQGVSSFVRGSDV